MDDNSVGGGSAHLTSFSQNHGSNVILLENNTVAFREASFANAVTISEKPLLPGEIFLVEIEQTEPGWTGHMRLGLTQQHPTSPLPLYSIPDLSNRGDSWICAITKYHNDIRVQSRIDHVSASASAEEDWPNDRRLANAAPASSTENGWPNGGIEFDAAPTISVEKNGPNGGNEINAEPTASVEDGPHNCGIKTNAALTSYTEEDELDGGIEICAASTLTREEEPNSCRETDASPYSSTREKRFSRGRDITVETNLIDTQDQDYAVNGLPPYQTCQDSSSTITKNNYSIKSKPFFSETASAIDCEPSTPSLCNHTSPQTSNNICSITSTANISPNCVLDTKCIMALPTRRADVSLSSDVLAGMSAYLSSNLAWELANCGISSNTSPIHSTDVTNTKGIDNASGSCTSYDSKGFIAACLLKTESVNQCNGVTTPSNNNSISLSNNNCNGDKIHGSLTDLVHGPTTTNGISDIFYNTSSSRIESSFATGDSQLSGVIVEDEIRKSSALPDTVNDKPNDLAVENHGIATNAYTDHLVENQEERYPTNGREKSPPAAVNPRVDLDEAYAGHVEGQGDGVDVGPKEYVSCLNRLTVGDHLCTSRGLVPCSQLLPSSRYRTALHPLATDEGSRIGLLYLPRVGGYANMHYIINGVDQGVFTRMLPYKRGPLHAVVDVYGTTKSVRIVQLYGVVSLKSACRATILQCLAPNTVSMLPLPPQLLRYLQGEDSPLH